MGVLFEGGGGGYSRGGGLINFAQKGRNFLPFLDKIMHLYAVQYPLYCLLNMSIFIVVKLKLSYFKIKGIGGGGQ